MAAFETLFLSEAISLSKHITYSMVFSRIFLVSEFFRRPSSPYLSPPELNKFAGNNSSIKKTK